MSSPLKNVSVEEVEAAIEEALQKFAKDGYKFAVSIKDLKFAETSPRVDVSMSAWERPTEDGALGKLF